MRLETTPSDSGVSDWLKQRELEAAWRVISRLDPEPLVRRAALEHLTRISSARMHSRPRNGMAERPGR